MLRKTNVWKLVRRRRGMKVYMVNAEEDQKSEGDGEDEFCKLHEVLEMGTLFQSLGGYQQKILVQNLKNLGAQRRKELTDEWKALLGD